jgi:hypothetical protein
MYQIKKNIRKDLKEKEKKLFISTNFLPKIKMPKNMAGNMKNVLDGSFLENDSILKQSPFFFYIISIAFLYIAINFYADRTLLKIEKTKEQLKELRFEHITTSSDLIQLTKASTLANLLKDKGIKPSIIPPQKIIIKND